MSALYVDRDAAALAAEKIKVFAQPQRLMILSCLLRGERNVGEIAEITGIGQPALSQQLAELRRADLVQNRKEAKQVWYMLADDRGDIRGRWHGREAATPTAVGGGERHDGSGRRGLRADTIAAVDRDRS